MKSNSNFYKKFLLLAFFLVLNGYAFGHPMPNTLVLLSFEDGFVKGEAQMPAVELETAAGFELLTSHTDKIKQYFLKHINAFDTHGKWITKIDKITFDEQVDENVGLYKEVHVTFTMYPADPENMRNFTFAYDAITHQIITHKVLVFLKYDWYSGMVAEDTARPLGIIELDVPTETVKFIDIDLDKGSFWSGTKAMFLYGMQHIRVGLDHILFLLTLLLIAPLSAFKNKWSLYQGFSYTVKRFLRISLAFTVGHSITLLIGSFTFFEVGARYIEALIAFSILITAVHCIRPIFYRKELIIAAVFGLVHGLAFSFSLAEINLNIASKLASVFSFNLGIETMQLIIMVCFSPVLFLSRFKIYNSIRIAIASLTGILSIAWVVERLFNTPNLITEFVSQFFV